MQITSPTLAELNRIMYEHPGEMDNEVLAWAISVLEHRVTLIPETAPAHEPYALRLNYLRRYRDEER